MLVTRPSQPRPYAARRCRFTAPQRASLSSPVPPLGRLGRLVLALGSADARRLAWTPVHIDANLGHSEDASDGNGQDRRHYRNRNPIHAVSLRRLWGSPNGSEENFAVGGRNGGSQSTPEMGNNAFKRLTPTIGPAS
jgi:hypothetical protein